MFTEVEDGEYSIVFEDDSLQKYVVTKSDGDSLIRLVNGEYVIESVKVDGKDVTDEDAGFYSEDSAGTSTTSVTPTKASSTSVTSTTSTSALMDTGTWSAILGASLAALLAVERKRRK